MYFFKGYKVMDHFIMIFSTRFRENAQFYFSEQKHLDRNLLSPPPANKYKLKKILVTTDIQQTYWLKISLRVEVGFCFEISAFFNLNSSKVKQSVTLRLDEAKLKTTWAL